MLRKILNKIYKITKALIQGFGWYGRDFLHYRSLLKKAGDKETIKLFPQIFDRDPDSHTFDKHYVYMDRWALKQLVRKTPSVHVDVGSSIRFLSMASVITRVKFVDIRPIKTDFDNFECIEGSILSMPFPDNSVNSLSCLHVAEHIGLGRYGDPLDIEGTKKSCLELKRVLAVGGSLYFALPIGKPAVYFNAHRVHNPEVILEYLKGLTLKSFSVVNDAGNYIEKANIQDYINANYACGCFEFVKEI